MTPAELGTTIREYRERAGLTQDGLGQLIAVDPDMIDQWEWGEEAPEDGEADRLAEVLGIPASRVKVPEVVIEVAPARELVVELVTGEPDAPPPIAGVSEHRRLPRPSEVPSAVQRARNALMADPRGAAWLAAGVIAVVLMIVFGLATSGIEFPAPEVAEETPTPTTAATTDALDTLREQRDRLADRVGELGDELEAAESRAAAAEAEATRLRGLGEANDQLEAENQRLVAENQILRKAVVVSSAADDVQAVALTFDAGGSDTAITTALDTLASKGVSASFFPSGAAVESNPELWTRAVGDGHELGNATMSGVGVTSLDTDELRDELAAWQVAVAEAVGVDIPATWFRPPFMDGFTDRVGSDAVRAVAAEIGMATALWNVETYWALFAPNGPKAAGSNPGAADVAEYVVATARPGSIVLLSTGSLDVAALPGIIDGLRAKGLEPTTLTGLFEQQERMLEGEIVIDAADPAA